MAALNEPAGAVPASFRPIGQSEYHQANSISVESNFASASDLPVTQSMDAVLIVSGVADMPVRGRIVQGTGNRPTSPSRWFST